MKRERFLDIIPECYVDTNLIEYLVDAGVNHQHCCSKVVSQLKTTFVDKFAVGIIDKDKVKMGYIDECDVIAQTDHLTLMKHRTRCQYLITIAPAVDKFVLDCARKQGVDTTLYNLPSTLKEFTKLSKSVTSNSDQRFKSLFAAIRNNQELHSLKVALKYLCANKYTANDGHLKDIFNGKTVMVDLNGGKCGA